MPDVVSAEGLRPHAGRGVPKPRRSAGLDAVCDLLLSGSPAADRPPEGSPPAPSAPPRGLYVLALGGVEPAARRTTALAVARKLAPRTGPAALFVFQNGSADAHILGDLGWGRLGPQAYLASADMGENAARLAARCDQVAVAVLDGTDAVPPALAPAVGRAVFVATPDAESLLETYREVKTWRVRAGVGGGRGGEASVFVVGSDGARGVGWLHQRLNKAARRFLDCEVGVQGYLDARREASAAEPLRLFADAPSARIWSALESPAEGGFAAHVGGRWPLKPADERSESAGLLAGPDAPPPAVLSLWNPPDRAALLAAVEPQVAALVGQRCRAVLRIEVDEPGAPPLAAVCDDGTLVAVLVCESAEGAAGCHAFACESMLSASERWLDAHRSLLARAYPGAGIRPAAGVSAIVLVPAQAAPEAAVRCFVAVRAGGRQGVVILPGAD